ncbi:MAG TPA: 2-oxoacid:acceptor oxidoreductase family protein [Candidatus Eisenbacteria bacterium]|nr:2-oxoacid:acceptor oxidoreductase family protein [Candidatus Eisenbacteria bacterium]
MSKMVATPASEPADPVQARATDSLVLAIVGSGGDGVALLGDMILRMAAHRGLYGVLVQSYGPQIRGGESAVVVRIASEEIHYEGDETDLLLCFRLADLRRFQGSIRLHPGSIVMLEASDASDPPEWLGRSELKPYRYPFATIVDGQEVPGDPKNMLGLALLCRALGWGPEQARHALEKRFAHRPQVLARNLATLDRGWAAAGVPTLPTLHGHGVPLTVETGNEAVARGAIAAGLRFFAGYPITPSSEIMETLIDELPAAGGRVVQAEDEIAALGMVIGASFAGSPAMTATSGPGLSLMTEMLGLASMAEIPAVVVDCQRVGPATGMPSRTEQSDLYHAVYGGHGDFPRAVLGVFDTVHARDVMFKAFHLAERYQLPVLVLSDAYVAQRRQIRDPVLDRAERPQRRVWKPGDMAARFDVSGAHGVGAFRIPGTEGGTYMAAGIEHTPDGNPTSDTHVHHAMNAKRFRKLDGIAAETGDWFLTLGRADAPLGIIAWGSMFGLLQQWVSQNPEYRVFLPEILHPFPLAGLAAWRRGLAKTWTLELSFQRQFHRYLASLTDLAGVVPIARSGGLPLSTAELSHMLTEASS